MKFQAKVSGKKQEWKDASPEELKAWSFEKRPGGWVIATREANGKKERVRFFYSRAKQQFWAKMHRAKMTGTGFTAVDFYGEKLAQARTGSQSDSASDFTAQFPGKVRKILAAEGQVVEVGTPLLMIEAMKMEFAIKATNAGTVKKILVAEGQQLTPGQKLLDFADQIKADAKAAEKTEAKK